MSMAVYRNNIHNNPPLFDFYVLHLATTNSIRSSGSSWWWNIDLPSVSSAKQYFIRATKVYIQDLNPASPSLRACILRSESCRLQNSFSTGLVASGDSAGYSNIIGVCEINHTTKSSNDYNFVAYNEEPHVNFISGGFINGGALQNGEFHIRICDLNNADFSFNATGYADAFFEITICEILNPQYTITNQFQHDRLGYAPVAGTQVQGRI